MDQEVVGSSPTSRPRNVTFYGDLMPESQRTATHSQTYVVDADEFDLRHLGVDARVELALAPTTNHRYSRLAHASNLRHSKTKEKLNHEGTKNTKTAQSFERSLRVLRGFVVDCFSDV